MDAYQGEQGDDAAGRAQAARAVARAVKEKPGPLLHGSATAVLVALGASILAPVGVAIAVGGIPTTIAGLFAGMGTNLVSERLSALIQRWRRDNDGDPTEDDLRWAIAADLTAALDRNDNHATALTAQLIATVRSLGGFEAALRAAHGELHDHLAACFTEIDGRQRKIVGELHGIRDGQLQLSTELRRQRAAADRAATAAEAAVDLLRIQQRTAPGQADQAVSGLAFIPVLPQPSGTASSDTAPPLTGEPDLPVAGSALIWTTASGTPSRQADDIPWRGGTEVTVRDRVYLLHGDSLGERFDASGSLLLREALARQCVPVPTTGHGHVWLRVAIPRYGGTGGARGALGQERALLDRAARVTGIPRVLDLVDEVGGAALAVSWPATRGGVPCRTLRAEFRLGEPVTDQWRLNRLLAGVRGLASTLARLHGLGITHRELTPDAIIVAGDGRFALRDLGLAVHAPVPGEGPGDYQAPEQRGVGGPRARPGPATDAYRLAAIAYHLVTGRLPAPVDPVPPRALNPRLADTASDVLTRALVPGPADRPGLSELRAALTVRPRGNSPPPGNAGT